MLYGSKYVLNPQLLAMACIQSLDVLYPTILMTNL